MNTELLKKLLLEKTAAAVEETPAPTMDKEAAFGSLFRLGGNMAKAQKGLSPVFKNALLLGSAGALIGGGAAAAQGLGSAIADPLRKRVGYKRMLRDNQFLKDEDPGVVGKIYNTLYRFSPTMAMDPLVSGSFMKKQLEFQDIGVQPNDLQTISNIEKAVKDQSRTEIIRSAFSPESMFHTKELS